MAYPHKVPQEPESHASLQFPRRSFTSPTFSITGYIDLNSSENCSQDQTSPLHLQPHRLHLLMVFSPLFNCSICYFYKEDHHVAGHPEEKLRGFQNETPRLSSALTVTEAPDYLWLSSCRHFPWRPGFLQYQPHSPLNSSQPCCLPFPTGRSHRAGSLLQSSATPTTEWSRLPWHERQAPLPSPPTNAAPQAHPQLPFLSCHALLALPRS